MQDHDMRATTNGLALVYDDIKEFKNLKPNSNPIFDLLIRKSEYEPKEIREAILNSMEMLKNSLDDLDANSTREEILKVSRISR